MKFLLCVILGIGLTATVPAGAQESAASLKALLLAQRARTASDAPSIVGTWVVQTVTGVGNVYNPGDRITISRTGDGYYAEDVSRGGGASGCSTSAPLYGSPTQITRTSVLTFSELRACFPPAMPDSTLQQAAGLISKTQTYSLSTDGQSLTGSQDSFQIYYNIANGQLAKVVPMPGYYQETFVRLTVAP